MENTTTLGGAQAGTLAAPGSLKVLVAASLGTLFEWYDFYLYASLASVIAAKFFNGVDARAGFIFTLLAYATGFLLRPFGALVFGRLGDMLGRKYTFLSTIVVMGLSTVCVGFLPTYATLGIAAPVILVILRMIQGLALGGEFGGAATYVAENSPARRRGRNTAWIVATGALGLLLSLGVVAVAQSVSGAGFADWGWRLPFLFSLVLLAISIYIRLSMQESPVFARLKGEGRLSAAPVREVFCVARNLKIMLVALFSICAGIAVIAYTVTVYPLFFLTEVLKVDAQSAHWMIGVGLVASPFMYWIFAALSDRIGRKPVMLTGYVLFALTVFPLYKGLVHFGNPQLEQAQASAPVVLHADPRDCSIQFNPIGTRGFTTSCDNAKRVLYQSAANYSTEALPGGAAAWIGIGSQRFLAYNASGLSAADQKQRAADFLGSVRTALNQAGYPSAADPSRVNVPAIVLILIVLVSYQGMVYGPGTAALVEMFPARIRYTAMSFPYHLATGWIGGLLPAGAFALIAWTGNIHAGLWYPMFWVLLALVSMAFFYRESKDNDMSL